MVTYLSSHLELHTFAKCGGKEGSLTTFRDFGLGNTVIRPDLVSYPALSWCFFLFISDSREHDALSSL